MVEPHPSSPASSGLDVSANASLDASADSGAPVAFFPVDTFFFNMTFLELEKVYSFYSADYSGDDTSFF